MQWVSSAVAGTLAANVALVGVLVFLIVQERDEAPRHLRWWTAAWSASIARYATTLALSLGAPPALQAVELLFALLNGWLLVQGTFVLLRRRSPPAIDVAFLAVGVWSVVAVWHDTPFLWRMTPAFVLLGLAMIGTGIVLARSEVAGRFGRLAGLVLVAWGVHRLDYPLLREVAWFAPIGFSLATLLEQLTAVCFVLVHVERSRGRLRASEERYRGLVEDAPVGIFRASLEGRLVDASPTFLRLLGARAVEDVTDDAWAQVWSALRVSEGASVEVDVELGRRALRIAVQGRRLAEGWQGIARDVTVERQLAERLHASERLETLGRLAGGVAHDFNNVLTVIQTGVSAARDERLPATARARVLGDVSDAAERGALITRKLLTLSRFRGARERFDLAEEVQSSARFLSRVAGEGVSIEYALDAAPVDAERVHVQQILMNLVANARDAMPEGGRIRIAVSRVDAPTHAVPDAPPPPWALLTVRDEGVGMDAATCERAFEAFFSTKEEGRGTGLGLVTVRAAAVTSGGSVRIRSAPGEGTTFEVVFPLADGRTSHDRTSGLPTSPPRVLLVDDDDAVRRALAEHLRREGLEVVEAEDAKDAMATFSRESVDVLVTDVRMVGLDGVSLAEALRERAPRLPVLLMSGFSELAVDEMQARVPGAAFVAKPLSGNELHRALNALVRRSG